MLCRLRSWFTGSSTFCLLVKTCCDNDHIGSEGSASFPSPSHVMVHKPGTNDTRIGDKHFVICYNNRTRQPLWVWERHLSSTTIAADTSKFVAKRDKVHFYAEKDPVIPTEFKVILTDYRSISCVTMKCLSHILY